jgi:hypothetical protein
VPALPNFGFDWRTVAVITESLGVIKQVTTNLFSDSGKLMSAFLEQPNMPDIMHAVRIG